ncbi:FadR/GntR family transcriptional regulator [Limobrevibacterium gyesilva]|uniref:GntR family transcriptional regulator n=1 Tax=Limobrevibacterium gyesilva TaxID=2991712 RepID=A0AA41YKL5_9PROT|nr:GntR family transcriptional regulator [Limobrevibacterium gyesilva]MCW3474330.1 GntR family transcriptional regulator [Limobrevibacterium gyesilva]
MSGQAIETGGSRSKSDADGQAIYRSLKELIAGGRMPAGARLPTERALATQFRAARNTVRKTMNQLADEGLVIRHVGRGTFVAEAAAPRSGPDYSLDELLEARLLFEPALVDLVVERATESDLAGLSHHLHTLRAAETWTEFKEAKYALHLAIVRAAKNRFLEGVFESIILSRRRSGWGRPGGRPIAVSAVRETAVRDNAAIIDALRQRDRTAARELIRTYLLRTLLSVGGS